MANFWPFTPARVQRLRANFAWACDMLHDTISDFLTTHEVARADGEVCAATVRQWANSGKLPAIRTASGMRLFRRDDVDRLLAARRAARAVKARP